MKICTICSNALQGQQQKYCSNKCKQKDHYHRIKEQTNTYHSQTTRALRRKLKLIEMMGAIVSIVVILLIFLRFIFII